VHRQRLSLALSTLPFTRSDGSHSRFALALLSERFLDRVLPDATSERAEQQRPVFLFDDA
jgi:hypothetical protein